MDISTSPINTAGLIRPTTQSTPTASPAPAPAANPIAAISKAIDNQLDNDAARDAAVVKAINSFEHTYAVSDKKFAIYKDASGQLITRYVSLRDGSITYSPAPSDIKAIPPQIAIRV